MTQIRMNSSNPNWSWSGRVVEKFAMSIIDRGEPDASYVLDKFYQGASGAVVNGEKKGVLRLNSDGLVNSDGSFAGQSGQILYVLHEVKKP